MTQETRYDLHAAIARLAEHEELKALRGACPSISSEITGVWHRWKHQEVAQGLRSTHPCSGCQGRDWVGETDLEKVAWRLHKIGFQGETEEAVLRAAEAWLEEKKRGHCE